MLAKPYAATLVVVAAAAAAAAIFVAAYVSVERPLLLLVLCLFMLQLLSVPLLLLFCPNIILHEGEGERERFGERWREMDIDMING